MIDVFQSDVQTTQPGRWLEINIMGFTFAYFQHVLFSKCKTVKFVNPGAAQVMMHETDKEDLQDIVDGCQLVGKEPHLVFFPVNNAGVNISSKGSHWSLLVFDGSQGQFISFDSMNGSNQQAAALLAKQLLPFMTRQTEEADQKDQKQHSGEKLICANCPQQTNSSDCGVYTLAISRFLADRWSSGKTVFDQDAQEALHTAINPSTVASTRNDIRKYVAHVTELQSKQ